MRRDTPTTFSFDVSDGGAGARAMHISIAHRCDGVLTPKERHDAARRKVRRLYPKLLKVFDLVVRNGKNRRESIFALAKTGLKLKTAESRYYRALNRLLKVL